MTYQEKRMKYYVFVYAAQNYFIFSNFLRNSFDLGGLGK